MRFHLEIELDDDDSRRVHARYRLYQCIFIVQVSITNMNRIFLISGIAVFVAAIFLLTNTPNMTMAYSCSSSSGTYLLKVQTGVSGSTGGCSTSSSATTTPRSFGTSQFQTSGPFQRLGVVECANGTPCSGTVSGQTAAGAAGSTIANSPNTLIALGTGGGGVVHCCGVGAQSAVSSSSGGSQSSCSSSFAKSADVVGSPISDASSQSQPGSCTANGLLK